MEELKLTKEEQRAVLKCKIKEENGLATQKDDEAATFAILKAICRHAADEDNIKKRKEMFKNLWKEIGTMFPEDKPLSDVPYFAIGQLGPLCISLLEEMDRNLTLVTLEKFEKVEGLLEHCIIEYVGTDKAKEDPIGISPEKAAEAETPDSVIAIKREILGHLQDAYENKNKQRLDAIFLLLNLSDFGIERIKRRMESESGSY